VLDHFTLTPAHSSKTFIFGRKDVSGSEGRFYVCDLKQMVTKNSKHVCVQTVSKNLSKFSKRKVDQARAARDMLARMGIRVKFTGYQRRRRTCDAGRTTHPGRVGES
jgi:hypothetical protein